MQKPPYGLKVLTQGTNTFLCYKDPFFSDKPIKLLKVILSKVIFSQKCFHGCTQLPSNYGLPKQRMNIGARVIQRSPIKSLQKCCKNGLVQCTIDYRIEDYQGFVSKLKIDSGVILKIENVLKRYNNRKSQSGNWSTFSLWPCV